MGTSRSWPVWTKKKSTWSRYIKKQFLGNWLPYHLKSASFEAEEPFCLLWLPWSLGQRQCLAFVLSEFREFANDWDRTSSPGNRKANDKEQSTVKTANNLLPKALSAGTDPYIAIFDYRNTPTQGMESSAVERLMYRRKITLLPTRKTLLQPRAPQSERVHPTTD